MRSRPRSNSSSSDGSLAKGNRVLIVATDNTIQRVPQYIGQVGTIKEAPVHPCTWFKIKFDDGEVFTFRPSALVGVEADYNPETGEGIIPSKHITKHASPEQLAKISPSTIVTPIKNRVFASSKTPKFLSDLDGDLWVGARVKITTGRMNKHEGVVLRSGNGWVQVETSTFGEVAKRAHELELVSYDTNRVARIPPMLPLNTPPQVAGSKRTYETAGFGNDDQSVSMRTSSGRQIRPRAFSDANSEDFDGNIRARNGNLRTQSYDSNGMLLTTPAELKHPTAPLIHPNIKEARNQYMQKYVKKMTEKLKHRPDLMYWTHMLKSSHVLSGGAPDPALERELARDFNDAVCPACLKERWPAAKYCWNEACPSSPVYFKLTGCPPPTVNESTNACTVTEPAIDVEIGVRDNAIKLTDDMVADDMYFNSSDHDHAVKARRHIDAPTQSAVCDAFQNLPGAILTGSLPQQAANTDTSGVILVSTDKSTFKVPNSVNGRALLVQKLVREGLTDNLDRICGDNWSVPENDVDRPTSVNVSHLNTTSVSISKLPATLTTIPAGQSFAFCEGKDVLPTPVLPQFKDYLKSQERSALNGKVNQGGLQLPGLPPRLPSILPQSTNQRVADGSTTANTLLLSGVASPTSSTPSARISPYLARGPDCFKFGAALEYNERPISPITKVV